MGRYAIFEQKEDLSPRFQAFERRLGSCGSFWCERRGVIGGFFLLAWIFPKKPAPKYSLIGFWSSWSSLERAREKKKTKSDQLRRTDPKKPRSQLQRERRRGLIPTPELNRRSSRAPRSPRSPRSPVRAFAARVREARGGSQAEDLGVSRFCFLLPEGFGMQFFFLEREYVTFLPPLFFERVLVPCL